jgi:formylglycine-generating enzyme required for sulfatase activity
MKPLPTIAAVLFWVGLAFANPEMTVDLPGGATMEFVWIEPGTFLMGSPDSELGRERDWEGPQHEVTISQGFWLGKCEVTQAQWAAIMGAAWWAEQERPHLEGKPNHAVMWVSWHEAQEAASRLNTAAGEPVYRLPTEAEWEYACRAGTTTRWSFGDDDDDLVDYAWCYDSVDPRAGMEAIQPVGGKLPNPWGLYDMHGNMREWVQDWFDVYDSRDTPTDPAGPSSGFYRTVRGGSFCSEIRYTRSASRVCYAPEDFSGDLGVRLVRTGPATTAVEPQTWGNVKAEVR